MATDWIDSAVRGIVPAVVALVFLLARRYLPSKPKREFDRRYRLDTLDVRFRSTQWPVGIAMMATAGLITAGGWLAFLELNRAFLFLDGPVERAVTPQRAMWVVAPFLTGISLSWDVILWLWSKMPNREEAKLYEFWSITRAGFDATRVLRILFFLIVAPGLLLTALAIPMHSVLSTNEIRARGYAFGGLQRYPYIDARRMTLVQGNRGRDGTVNSAAAVVLDFADGRRWSSAHNGELVRVVDSDLIKFLERKTGLSPDFETAEEDIDPLRPGQRH